MITRPKFANEAEEADWYAANPDYILQQLEKADAEGRLSRGSVSKQLKLKQNSAASMPFVLNDEDLRLAMQQAETKGIDLRVYVESLLHNALQNAAQH